MNLEKHNLIRLTNNGMSNSEASFSPDGSKIVFVSDRSGNSEVWVMNANGTQPIICLIIHLPTALVPGRPMG